MSLENLDPIAARGGGPVPGEASQSIQSVASRPAEFFSTRVVPRAMVSSGVRSSLSTYLELLYKVGIGRHSEEQSSVPGRWKWFELASLKFIKFIPQEHL